MLFLCLDDILKKNLFLSKYAQSADQISQLGKSCAVYIVIRTHLTSFFCVVEEVRYERVLPTYNAADVKTSTEFNFVIPPSSEYFTRYRVCVQLYVLGVPNVVFFSLVFRPITKWSLTLK